MWGETEQGREGGREGNDLVPLITTCRKNHRQQQCLGIWEEGQLQVVLIVSRVFASGNDTVEQEVDCLSPLPQIPPGVWVGENEVRGEREIPQTSDVA